jgi:hypothetical protein
MLIKDVIFWLKKSKVSSKVALGGVFYKNFEHPKLKGQKENLAGYTLAMPVIEVMRDLRIF